MLAELRDRAEAAIALARRSGASDAWASASRSRGVSVEVRDGAIEKLQESTSRGLSIQLYVDGRYATYRTSDLRAEPLAAFIRDAVAMTRALERDPFRRIPEPALYEGRSSADLELKDEAVLALDVDTRVAWCQAMHTRCQHERLVSATIGVNDSHGLVASASSNGFSGHHERTSSWRGVNVTLEDEGDARPASHYWVGARHLEDLPSPAEVGAEGLRQGVRRLGGQQGPTARTTMVVEPRVGARLIGLLLGPASARAFNREQSFWRGRVGDTLISEHLTITDEPLLPRGLGSRYYDGEGIAARPRPIVEGGALRTPFVDTYYGRKTELAPTTGGASNLVVAPGERDLAAIIAETEAGYLVTGWLGGNSDATTGDFSLGMRGHRIVDGALTDAVQEMNITGNLLTLFSNLSEVGSDPWLFSSRRVPTLVFDEVQFSGA